MHKRFKSSATLILLSSAVAMSSVACNNMNRLDTSNLDLEQIATSDPTPSPVPAVPPQPQFDPFQLAISRASSAFTISQSAQSRDDWRLVASRWQQAIDLLASIPTSNPNHTQAQHKMGEYRRNLAYAQQQANRPNAPESDGVVAIAPQPIAPQSNSAPTSASIPQHLTPTTNDAFQVPIVRRAGGTPIISVTFNDSQHYEMIVDTGASGTLITQQMATGLGVTPVGQTQVDTASARAVSFPLGYVRSIQVGNAVTRNVLVAVAGPDLDTGLLGHDFFGNYDITIRENVVEFQPR
jgi:predicted aspartyl protease